MQKQKRVKMLFSTNPHPNVIELVKELEEKRFIDGDTIVYDDKDESVIAALFDKYCVSIL